VLITEEIEIALIGCGGVSGGGISGTEKLSTNQNENQEQGKS